MTTWHSLVRPGDLVFDVGAGDGQGTAILDGLTPGTEPVIPLLSFELEAAAMNHLRPTLERLQRLGYRHFTWRPAGDAELTARWLDATELLHEIARHAERDSRGALRGDVFARAGAGAGTAEPTARQRYAVSILRQPGNIHSECFRELAETVHGGLTELGHDSIISEDTRVAGRRNIVFGSNLIANLDQPHTFAPGSILYNLEQIYDRSPWVTADLLAAFRAHTVWDYSRANIDALARHGITAQHVPVGYLPALTRIPAAPVQDVDVLFIGALSERRLSILKALERAGARVMAVFGLYGRARDRLIARAKVVLNIHFYDAKVFEIVRVSYLLANRCFVVSETGSDGAAEAAFAGGVVFAPYERLIETCRGYLNEPGARRAVAARGFATMAALGETEMLRPIVGDARAAPAMRSRALG